jgi:hypothetical protein
MGPQLWEKLPGPAHLYPSQPTQVAVTGLQSEFRAFIRTVSRPTHFPRRRRRSSHVLPQFPLPLRRRPPRRRKRSSWKQRAPVGFERRDLGVVIGEADTEGAAGPQRLRLLRRA